MDSIDTLSLSSSQLPPAAGTTTSTSSLPSSSPSSSTTSSRLATLTSASDSQYSTASTFTAPTIAIALTITILLLVLGVLLVAIRASRLQQTRRRLSKDPNVADSSRQRRWSPRAVEPLDELMIHRWDTPPVVPPRRSMASTRDTASFVSVDEGRGLLPANGTGHQTVVVDVAAEVEAGGAGLLPPPAASTRPMTKPRWTRRG
ncbi:hypothetical protein HDU96_001147 [Phlyctochytrium bullatum]|nr:hypothetical protein HDU96_001147 [Phlyctochytrium bullatum]